MKVLIEINESDVSLKIDGHEMKCISAFELKCVAGETPMLTMTIPATHEDFIEVGQ